MQGYLQRYWKITQSTNDFYLLSIFDVKKSLNRIGFTTQVLGPLSIYTSPSGKAARRQRKCFLCIDRARQTQAEKTNRDHKSY